MPKRLSIFDEIIDEATANELVYGLAKIKSEVYAVKERVSLELVMIMANLRFGATINTVVR